MNDKNKLVLNETNPGRGVTHVGWCLFGPGSEPFNRLLIMIIFLEIIFSKRKLHIKLHLLVFRKTKWLPDYTGSLWLKFKVPVMFG